MQRSEQPLIEIQRAEGALQEMIGAKSLDDFEESWKGFLHRLERTWNKTKAHYGKSPKWSNWSSEFERLRREDRLLSYLINARGAEEHTVNEIVEREPGGIAIKAGPTGSVHIRSMKISTDGIHLDASAPVIVEFIAARTKLLPVLNRGRQYPVPTQHLGMPIDPSNVVALAAAGIKFYKRAVQEAEAFFVK